MTSAVSICNSALDELGQSSITKLTDANKAARLCNSNYESQRDLLLRRHPWTFAMKRATLSELSAAPAFEYTNQFALPSDYLKEWYINGNDYGDYDYKIEQYNGQKVLLIDEDTVQLVYTANVTDPVLFDTIFREVLSLKIAAKIAYALTGSASLAQRVKQEAEELYAEATAADSQEGVETQIEKSNWLNARV